MTEPKTASPVAPEPPILFFDGVCGLCNRFVDFTMRRDPHARLRYAPLQGSAAAERLPESDRAELKSVVLCQDGQLSRKSTAVARTLWILGGFWRVIGGLLWCVPLPLRNLGYSVIAAQRYRIFGKKETCRLPTPEERVRFLD